MGNKETPPIYPFGYKYKALKDAVKEKQQRIFKHGHNLHNYNYVMSEIQLGSQELQERRNKWVTWLTFGVSFLSLSAAMGALYVSSENRDSSKQWETRQIELLERWENRQIELLKKMDGNNSQGNSDLLRAIENMIQVMTENQNSKELPQKRK